MLERFAPGNEALHGDLDEEFSSGRSSIWYWRQVLAAIARQGPLAVRARGLVAAENFVTGIITLVMIGFYAAFVVNVTQWLLRSEGAPVWARLPNALGAVNGGAFVLTFVLGLTAGRWIARRHRAHRVVAIVTFGGATMLCAAAALKAVSLAADTAVFLPAFLEQVGITASFVIGLVGGVSAVGFRPTVIPLGLARPRATP
jgi:hypothetical protein